MKKIATILMMGITFFPEKGLAMSNEEFGKTTKEVSSNIQQIKKFNKIIDLHSHVLKPSDSISKSFFQDLEEINLWVNEFFEKYGQALYKEEAHEKYMAVLSTIKTMAFLHLYGESLFQLKEAQPEAIAQHFKKLCGELNLMKPPLSVNEDERPEEKEYEPAFLDFEKINRNLFGEVDYKLNQIFEEHMSKDEINFAYPIVEWAANIFHFSFSKDLVGEKFALDCSKVFEFLQNYNPENLKEYLMEVWPILVKQFSALKEFHQTEYQKKSSQLINLLTCTMCYPARVQLLRFNEKTAMVSEKIEEENHQVKKRTITDVVDKYFGGPKLVQLTQEFYYRRCAFFGQIELEELLSEHDLDEKCEEIQKQHSIQFCTHYLQEMVDYILKTYAANLKQSKEISSEELEHLKADNGKQIRVQLVNLYSYFGIKGEICKMLN
jgi:hypothetical protein